MHQRVDTDVAQRIQIQLLDIGRVRLEHHLELIIMLQTVGVLAIAAIGRAAAGLHIGRVPDFRADRAQEGGRVEGACTYLHVVGLQDYAALLRPEGLQGKDQALEGLGGRVCLCHVFHRSTVK